MKDMRVSKDVKLIVVPEGERTSGSITIVSYSSGSVFILPEEIDKLIILLAQAKKLIPAKKARKAKS